ncbi:heterokaryon incompatibility protein-domain-containing protein [Triangularia setosa]|uniref:Heterokaryon incompatibility protein-domain-containing protein n=1 Tax=Triangularia setosa TaxID=2587417 RepID=A0AAN7A1V3_9PEZI|nr:heterokaryon incompatibility protein-domain-containing protein [Podospora setosa]
MDIFDLIDNGRFVFQFCCRSTTRASRATNIRTKDCSPSLLHPTTASAHTMSRWHLETCMTPDVVMTGVHIHCKLCNQTPDIDKLVVNFDHQNSSDPSIPPDEPYGAYKLSWPPGIPYKTAGHDNTVKESLQSQHEAESDKLKDSASNPEITATYEKALGPHEFRLICLPSTDDTNSPIHLTLETYSDERYPEYETVSYTWAGEDGDGSLCKPVFVGPYWDMLLQTKNCWEMLRFLRPHRGYRLVWVDAICINQLDSLERASQVAKMGAIYKNSRRTIVYLGSAIVHVGDHAYPLRHSAKEAATLSISPHYLISLPTPTYNKEEAKAVFIGPDGKLKLSQLLLCRYFSRIWVIQELLLSRQVSIPVGDMEISFDSLSINALVGQGDQTRRSTRPWDNTLAPWLQYLSRGGYLRHGLLEWTLFTSLSHASDSRDELFSLLGLIPDNTLKPDYTISRLHAQIGVAAHSLFCRGSFESFYIAPTQRNNRPNEFPSWVPYRLRTKQALSVPWTSEEPEHVLREFYESLKRHFDKSYSGRYSIFQPEEDGAAGQDRACWTVGATVDANTAALTLTATHLATFTNAPVLVPFTNSAEWEAYVVRSNGLEMYLLSTRASALDQVVQPLDHLYWLHGDYEKRATPGFLVLRLMTESGSNHFKLIGFCSQVLFVEVYVGRKTVKNKQLNRSRSFAIHYLPFSRLQRRLKQAVDQAVGEFGCLEELFPGVCAREGQLLSFLALTSLASWPSEPFLFLSEYLRHLDLEYDGVISKEMREFEADQHEVEILTITVPSADISKFVLSWGLLRFPFSKFQRISLGEENEDLSWDETRIIATETLAESDMLRLRAELTAEDLADLRKHEKLDDGDGLGLGEQHTSSVLSSDALVVWRCFQELRKARWATRGMKPHEIVKLVQSSQDTSTIACPDWPVEIVDAFQVQGNTSKVTIV